MYVKQETHAWLLCSPEDMSHIICRISIGNYISSKTVDFSHRHIHLKELNKGHFGLGILKKKKKNLLYKKRD